jgi:hypothetical protein
MGIFVTIVFMLECSVDSLELSSVFLMLVNSLYLLSHLNHQAFVLFSNKVYLVIMCLLQLLESLRHQLLSFTELLLTLSIQTLSIQDIILEVSFLTLKIFFGFR